MDLSNPTANSSQPAGQAGPENALAIATLQDVLSWLRQNTALPASRRTQLEAGVRAFGRVLDRPVESIPALPHSLGRLFASLTPTTTGKAGKTLANTVSLVKAAIAAAGVGRRIRFNGKPLRPEW